MALDGRQGTTPCGNGGSRTKLSSAGRKYAAHPNLGPSLREWLLKMQGPAQPLQRSARGRRAACRRTHIHTTSKAVELSRRLAEQCHSCNCARPCPAASRGCEITYPRDGPRGPQRAMLSNDTTTQGGSKRWLPVASPKKRTPITSTEALHGTAWTTVAPEEMPMASSPMLALVATCCRRGAIALM